MTTAGGDSGEGDETTAGGDSGRRGDSAADTSGAGGAAAGSRGRRRGWYSGSYQGDPWRPWQARESLDILLAGIEAPSSDVLEAIFGHWAEIVGADLAEHCRPVSVQGDLLTVAASDPAWASELRWLEREVLRRVHEVTGADRIRHLKVRTDLA